MISAERCYNHAGREAAARCLSCGRSFCRECVTDHAGRLLCSRCLAAVGAVRSRRSILRALRRLAAVAAGFFLLWTTFYQTGKLLMAIPDTFQLEWTGEGEGE